MRFDSSDLMAILRLFGLAHEDNMPRQIERIEKSKPHDKNVLIRFAFGKQKYAVLIDSAAEDDEDYIYEQAVEQGIPHQYELVANPNSSELMTYGMPYRGKECYLMRDQPTHIRLDIAMVERFGEQSRSTYQKHIAAGQVHVNGAVQTSPKYPVSASDTIEFTEVEQSFSMLPYEVIYEDEHVLVINKPAGMLTHAKGAIAEEFTAADIIKPLTQYKQDTNRPGIVHRLDRDTSGVLLMVKTEAAAAKIQHQFSDRTTKKQYIALTSGEPKQPSAVIDLPIERNPNAPSTFRVGPNGKTAQTTYEVLQTNHAHSLIKLRPKTGRTHQLRVHMQYIGCPIVGDKVYGVEVGERMYLHAASLEVTLPGGERRVFEAPLPPEFTEL
jgi:23S rRNA pseudouridine1911/1915/1917 synthase